MYSICEWTSNHVIILERLILERLYLTFYCSFTKDDKDNMHLVVETKAKTLRFDFETSNLSIT